MPRARRAFVLIMGTSALLVTACHDESQAPPSRPEPPLYEGPGGTMLAPLDLVYVCGNKFLATNATVATVELEYRVVGTNESGSITLRPGVAEGDQSWSETELETRNRGVVELYQDDQRVARRRNEGRSCGAAPFSALVASAGEAESGSWSAPFPWPVVALHLSLLSNSKVLSWGKFGTPQIWDPATGVFTPVSSPANLFCSGHSFLSDGRLLVAGGHISDGVGIKDVTIFSPGLQKWSSSTPMRLGRWYPTNTMLGTGDILIIGGSDLADHMVAEPEVWSPSGGLRVLSTASLTLPYYPRTFLAPNGLVFYAGEDQTTRYLNTSGTGSWTTVGSRLYGVRDYGSAVMYDDGKILYAGGGRTTNTAEIIDLNSSNPTWQWTGSMTFPRRHLNLTVLPTGEVLATGGSSGTTFNDLTRAVHAAEIWNPSTGVWTMLASNTVNRVYHSTSLLLPDGRVLHSGSGGASGAVDELNAELFSPPYLFKGPRPTITDAPTAVGYTIPFRVQTPQFATVSKVSLIRMGSVTHAFDQSGRFQWLTFTRDAGGLIVKAPTKFVRTPAGFYMLFILDNGVPSVAKIVKVGNQSSQPAPTPNAAPVANFDFTCNVLSCNFTDSSTDSDGTVAAWSWTFGDNSTSNTQNPNRTYASQGTYSVTLTVTDNKGGTDQHTVLVTVPTGAPVNAPPTASFTNSCTQLACTFTDGSTDTDGTVTGWSWDFGDNTSANIASPSHTYATGGTYTVTLVATDNGGANATTNKVITVAVTVPNAAPKAKFAATCNALICRLSSLSSDTDGSVVAMNWTFGDASSMATTDVNIRHTYAASGSYAVTLQVTDDDGATAQTSKTIPITSAITLSATGQADATQQNLTLTWSGASGTTVDVYLNRALLKQEPNDGLYTFSRPLPGLTKYTFSVCQLGSTTLCSNESIVNF